MTSRWTLPRARMPTRSEFGALLLCPCDAAQEPSKLPSPIVHAAFLSDIEGKFGETSTADQDRLYRSHGRFSRSLDRPLSLSGQTFEDMYQLTRGSFERVPDLVIWPESHAHCEGIVAAAVKHNVVIIPFGGTVPNHPCCASVLNARWHDGHGGADVPHW